MTGLARWVSNGGPGRRTLLLFLVLGIVGGLAGAAQKAPACGLVDDGKTHRAPDYLSFAPGAKGWSYVDPAFGCTVTRLSKGAADFKSPVYHEYATMFAINADDSKILLMPAGGSYYVVDMSGNTIIPPGVLEPDGTGEARWHRTDPNVIHYRTRNQLKKATISGSLVRNSLIRTFAGCRDISFGGGEGDISEDGDHLVVACNNDNIAVYTFSKNTLGPSARIDGLDYCDMTPNNNVICNHSGRFDLYDQNMHFIRTVVPFAAHADRGRDVNGDEVLVAVASNDMTSVCPSSNGYEKIRLSDSRKTCLLNLPWWGQSSHVGVSLNGWAVLSITDYSSPGTASYPLATNWQGLWDLYMNEVVLVKLDGTEVRRLAHHRSRAASTYWKLPRAAISMDGKYVLFTSDMGQGDPVGAEYGDVYLIAVDPGGRTSTSPRK